MTLFKRLELLKKIYDEARGGIDWCEGRAHIGTFTKFVVLIAAKDGNENYHILLPNPKSKKPLDESYWSGNWWTHDMILLLENKELIKDLKNQGYELFTEGGGWVTEEKDKNKMFTLQGDSGSYGDYSRDLQTHLDNEDRVIVVGQNGIVNRKSIGYLFS